MTFYNDDEAFMAIEGAYGVTVGGIIYPLTDAQITPDQSAAIDYLCDEWDYAYEPQKPVK